MQNLSLLFKELASVFLLAFVFCIHFLTAYTMTAEQEHQQC